MNYFECTYPYPQTINGYFIYKKNVKGPVMYHAVYADNLTSSDAVELYERKVKEYKMCNLNNLWSETWNISGKYSNTNLSNGIELIVQMNYDANKQNYNVAVEVVWVNQIK